MKILLTGKPKSGKSTLLEDFITSLTVAKNGFLTRELKQGGERVGFELVNTSGESAILATINSSSITRVSKYGVDLDSLDNFLNRLDDFNAKTILYADEIGQMQLYSEIFKSTVTRYLDAPNGFIGTISKVYSDDFTDAVLKHKDIILLDLDSDREGQLRKALMGLASNLPVFNQLSIELKNKIEQMAIGYADDVKFVQLGKLWKNAIKYLAEDRVSNINGNTFQVMGNTDKHTVSQASGDYYCECDLFNGRGDYINIAGECSHIQSVKLKYF